MAIITTAEFKAYRGITASTHDAQIALMIADAQDLIEIDTDRRFDEATYEDEAYNGTGTDTLQLRQFPVSAFTAVKHRDYAGEDSEQDIGSYRHDPETGLVKLVGSVYGRAHTDAFGLPSGADFGHSARFPPGFRNVLVTYTAGYAAADMPPALKHIMYEIVGEMYEAVKGGARDNTAMQSETLGARSYTRRSLDEVFRHYRSRIQRFRRVVL